MSHDAQVFNLLYTLLPTNYEVKTLTVHLSNKDKAGMKIHEPVSTGSSLHGMVEEYMVGM